MSRGIMFEFLFKYPYAEFAKGEIVSFGALPVEARIVVVVILGFVALLLYRQVSDRISNSRRRLLVAIRWLVLAILFFMLGLPVLQSKVSPKNALFTAFLIDTSRSMSISDMKVGDKTLSRIEAVNGLVLGPQGLAAEVGQQTKTLLYTFDSQANRYQADKPFVAEGRYTDIFKSVRDMESDLRALPLVAVVMLTDGCRTAGGKPLDGAQLLAARGVPLHIVGVGSAAPPKDYEVMRVVAPRRVRQNTEIEVQATVRHTDFNAPFNVQILRGENVIETRKVEPEAGSDTTLVKLRFTPEHRGSATHKIRIPVAADEKIKDNNEKQFVIDMSDDRLPVLYVEGSPRMEYRFLRRAMFRDRDFRVVGMLRLAKNRFYVQGANDLEKVTQSGETEQIYLSKGFPDTPEKLHRFQAVILGDIEASFFTADQQKLLDEFVKNRGGGLLMLGGVNSFGLGGYANTPVGQLLPVTITPQDQPYSDDKFKAKFTEDGLKHPLMHLLDDKVANRQLWHEMPELIGITPVGRTKTGAQTLIYKQTGAGQLPVLAIQQAGNGRVAAFTSGGSWFWQMSRPASDEFHEKFWKQAIRWLVVGSREQIEAGTDREICAKKEPVTIQATVLDRSMTPANNATVLATVTDPLNNTEKIPLEWVLSEDGVYKGRFVPGDEGNYTVSISVEGESFKDVKPATTGFLVTEPLVEFSDAGLKEELLKEMAKAADGKYYAFDEAANLSKNIKKNVRATLAENAVYTNKPLWDMPVFFIALLVLVTSEWIVRRVGGDLS